MTTASDRGRREAIRHTMAADADAHDFRPFLPPGGGASFLITGAGGMIGAHLALSLLATNARLGLGWSVYGLSRDMAKSEWLFAGSGLRGISRDVSAPIDDLPRFDYIIHAASPVGPAVFAEAPASVVTANITGTVNLLQKAVRDGTERFLLISTHEVYGRGEDVWREENAGIVDFLSPRACYPESKRAGENACVGFHRQYGLHVGIARLSRVVGPNMNLDSGLFVCDFLKDGLAKRPVLVRGNAALRRPLAYAADVADALARILFSGEAGGAYNVAPEEAPDIGEVAEHVAGLAGVPVVKTLPEGLPEGAVQDISRIRGLGWRQRTDWRRGLDAIWKTF